MCGIAGIISRDEGVVRRALPLMTDAQAHRGPDDRGVEVFAFGDAFLGLGHRRLSILDLSPCGHQPMAHPATGDQIVFNGEIYNFQTLRKELEAGGSRFSGHSDTEVLLHALSARGPECIARLQGMFALAYFDARGKRLVLARDSIGIKPLYVAEIEGGRGLLFASEVRALLASGLVPRTIDPRGVAGLLAYGAVQHPLTVFKGVRSFSAGCWQVLRPEDLGAGSGTAVTRYWSFPPAAAEPPPEAAVVERVRETIDSAVRDHLVADVPVGLFLSSGLDSTIVAGVAARHTPHLRSFTVGFEDQPDFSEMRLAMETARCFGLGHTEVQVTGREAEESARAWLASLDQPSIDGLNVFVISRAVRRHGIVVALSGQGGDELFGGYPSFFEVPTFHRIMRKTAWMPLGVRRGLARVATVGRSEAYRQKALGVASSDGGLLGLYLHRRRAMSDQQLQSLGLDARRMELTADFMPPEALEGVNTDPRDIIWTVSRLETQFYLGNMLLRDGDANGMAHSLEIRVPLLDQRLLDLALPLPGRVRLPKGSRSKHLLRQAFGDLLREEVQAQGKRGFDLPFRRWMLGPLRELADAGMSSLKSSGLLDAAQIDALWRTFERQPESPIWSRVLSLWVLGLYLKQTGAAA